MRSNIDAEIEQRLHEIKSMMLDGVPHETILLHCKTFGFSNELCDTLILRACSEIDEMREEKYHENQTRVLTHLWHVYYRACQAKDLTAQVAALGKIGQFSGLSEKRPYKKPLRLPFTDDELREALETSEEPN